MADKKRTHGLRWSINETLRTVQCEAWETDADGKEVTLDTVTFDTKKAHEDNVFYASLHGFKQRLSDTAAQNAGTSLQDKLTAIRAIVEHYESGSPNWDRTRTAAPRKSVDEMLAELDPAILERALEAARQKAANATG